MKSNLKYYAQVIGVNLLAALAPILAVVLIYGIGKLKVMITHPSFAAQWIYDCCLWAITISLVGFFIGFLLLVWADKWRKTKLSALKVQREFEELGIRVVVKVKPIEERTGQKNTPASDNSEFEDISGMTVKEIWELYKGREIDLLAGNIFIAGYDEESCLVIVGTKFYKPAHGYDEMVKQMVSKDPDKWHIEKGYADYGALSTKYIHIYKRQQ